MSTKVADNVGGLLSGFEFEKQMIMISKKDELFNWLEQKADFSIADKSYLAQLIHDIQLERPQNLQQTDCYTMLPLVQQIIQSRIKHFEEHYHSYEANELKQALSTIERLIPPSSFEVSSGNIV